MRLWDWAVQAYARPAVADACLALQDRHGQNVPYLLWAAWAGREDEALLQEAAQMAASWEAAAVGPLRQARRALKTPQPPVADAAREALREQVKACELAAERVLLEALEAITPSRGALPAAAALTAAVRAWNSPAPAKAVADLADALG